MRGDQSEGSEPLASGPLLSPDRPASSPSVRSAVESSSSAIGARTVPETNRGMTPGTVHRAGASAAPSEPRPGTEQTDLRDSAPAGRAIPPMTERSGASGQTQVEPAGEGNRTASRELSDTPRRRRETLVPESGQISPAEPVSPRGARRTVKRASERIDDTGAPEAAPSKPTSAISRVRPSPQASPAPDQREIVRRRVEEGDRRHPWDERIIEVSRRSERSVEVDTTSHRSGALVAPASPQMGDGRVSKPKTWPPADAEAESRGLRASSSERREEPSGPGQSESVEPPARRGVEIEPRVIRHVERGRPASSQSSRPDDRAERTINVTIGRVEVRAAGPPAAPAPKKRRSEPPVMSLDEYLRQRRDGGSR